MTPRNVLAMVLALWGLTPYGCCGPNPGTSSHGGGEQGGSTGSPAVAQHDTAKEPGGTASSAWTASAVTPESCEIAGFTEPVQVGEALREMGQGESDFAAGEGYSCLVYQDIGGFYSSDAIYIKVMDGKGRVVAERESSAQRLEYRPSVVAAPWGGFVVAYHWTKDSTVEQDHVVARTLGYDGKWADKGWVVSTRSSEKSVRVRNLGDRVGIWWEEYQPNKDRYVDSYAEIVDGKKVAGKVPGEPPALDIASWHEKLSSASGWPVPAGKKGVRIRWDGEKFVVSWKKVKESGTRYRFYWFAATCR